jgi:hypothetical protein
LLYTYRSSIPNYGSDAVVDAEFSADMSVVFFFFSKRKDVPLSSGGSAAAAPYPFPASENPTVNDDTVNLEAGAHVLPAS